MAKKPKQFSGPRAAISAADNDSSTPSSGVSDTISAPKAKVDLGNTSFSSAFRAARNAGDKTFTWNGKSYTTQMASSKPASKPAARSSSPSSSSSSSASKPTADSIKSAYAPWMKAMQSRAASSGSSSSSSAPKPSDSDWGKKVQAAADAKRASQQRFNPDGSINPDAVNDDGTFKYRKGGKTKKFAKGGGIEKKGKTKAKMIKMAKGGSIDGIAIRGKTRAKKK